MKFRKVILWGLSGVLGLSALAILGGYCWLYSWTWEGTPTPHASLTAAEVQKLLDFDAFITNRLPESFRERMKREIDAFGGDSVAYELDDEGELTRINSLPAWLEELKLWYSSAAVSRTLLQPARKSLHRLLETGALATEDCFLAALAMQKQDVPLVQFMVEKGLNPSSPFMEIKGYLLSELMLGSNGNDEYLPVKERIALLDWMLARGVDIHAVEEERMLLMSELSLAATDDGAGAILDWFVRHGYKLNATSAALVLLRYKEALPTYQQLISDGFLPPVPQEIASPGVRCTPLQYVVGDIRSLPDTVRWLLALGLNPNALPVGADAPAPEDEIEERPRIFRKVPIDACLESIRYTSLGQSEEEDARLRGKLEILDILLQHGAVPTAETRELLPLDRALDKEVTELFRKHSFHLDAGENPYNACCSPE